MLEGKLIRGPASNPQRRRHHPESASLNNSLSARPLSSWIPADSNDSPEPVSKCLVVAETSTSPPFATPAIRAVS
jgi:hypothetical protein